jgi:hypothetical protein
VTGLGLGMTIRILLLSPLPLISSFRWLKIRASVLWTVFFSLEWTRHEQYYRNSFYRSFRRLGVLDRVEYRVICHHR